MQYSNYRVKAKRFKGNKMSLFCCFILSVFEIFLKIGIMKDSEKEASSASVVRDWVKCHVGQCPRRPSREQSLRVFPEWWLRLMHVGNEITIGCKA